MQHSIEQIIDEIVRRFNGKIVLGLPLGLGKPLRFLNALVKRANEDRTIDLTIITALSLEKPQAGSGLQKRLASPIIKRLFKNYQEPLYISLIRQKKLPKNIRVREFYVKAGSAKNSALAQQDYISVNYTHVAQALHSYGVNLIAHWVAVDSNYPDKISLSCNPDITLDLFDPNFAYAIDRSKVLLVAEVQPQLPYMYGKAEILAKEFDWVIPANHDTSDLFCTPNTPISETEHCIGLRASALIADGGTLQIGIGALSDAIVNALIVRQHNNSSYRQCIERLEPNTNQIYTNVFQRGLYGSSEMLVHGFLHLIDAGILKRNVIDDFPLQQACSIIEKTTDISPLNESHLNADTVSKIILQLIENNSLTIPFTKKQFVWLQQIGLIKSDVEYSVEGLIWNNSKFLWNDLQDFLKNNSCVVLLGNQIFGTTCLHAGFFLGPNAMYEKLRNMSVADLKKIQMRSVGFINQIYGSSRLKILQRQHARFINTAMMVTLSGAAVSDALEDGTVISGVGGQYNFVAMAHELLNARSIICLRSTLGEGSNARSNIRTMYGHITIPKHLRDVVITEYGIAELRGKTDAEICDALIRIADSRFQKELIEFAQKSNKLPRDYQIPEYHRANTPNNLNRIFKELNNLHPLVSYPFGHDLTEEEEWLSRSLAPLKTLNKNPQTWFNFLKQEHLKAFSTKTYAKKITEILGQDGQIHLQELWHRMQVDQPASMMDHVVKWWIAHRLYQELNHSLS
ncbi:MAG: acetyl-CoA hydrolase/transferase C-terminal domain-containing protein [Pseudomonadota bacterium]